MVQTEIRSFVCAAAALVVLGSCAPSIRWERHIMDGHRTGVTSVVGSDVASALGTVEDSVYHAPNGSEFIGGSTPAVASLMLGVQPDMAYLKEVIGYSPREMTKYRPESELSNWAADVIRLGVEKTLGVKADLAITNLGGIRTDMPEGDILIDTIVSMFPFNNRLCYVRLAGSDVRAIFNQFAVDGKFEAVSGVNAVAEGGKITSLEIGDEPLDDNRDYILATIDFLLDGGDGLSLAKNAKELVLSKVKVNEWMVPYVRSLTAEGKNVEGVIDGRVTVR